VVSLGVMQERSSKGAGKLAEAGSERFAGRSALYAATLQARVASRPGGGQVTV